MAFTVAKRHYNMNSFLRNHMILFIGKAGVCMFPEKIRELRLINKMTQQEIADQLGITRPAYTAYESGKREPDFSILQSIADIFGVTTDYLLGRTKITKKTLKSEVIHLDKILRSTIELTYKGKELSLKDREMINIIIAGYFLAKKQLDGNN